MNYQNRGLSHLPKPKAEADNTDTGFDNSGYHAKTQLDKCFIITFPKPSAKEDTFLWVCKNLRTLHGLGAWKLGRFWTQHDNPISAADIGLLFWNCREIVCFYYTFILNLTFRLKSFGTSEYFLLKALFALMSSFVVQW